MEQQAWILRSILTQLESQEAADEGAPNCIAGEFARLKNQSTKYRIDKVFSTKTAEKQENIKKNRYKDIVPFDHTRVKLTLTTSKKDSDYINASYIKGISGTRAYIATQGPLPHTLVDFLRMIWEYNINVIVMSCREFEMGKKKCEVYWPQNQEDTFVCEAFTVHCNSEESKGDYVTRTLRLTYRNCSRTLKQLHYINWPDHGVPDTIPPILDMLHEMRCYQAHDDIPICIHCSAGCGRTGALCVIDYTWNLLRSQMITSDFNIYNLVQDMRTQRPSVVQTKPHAVTRYAFVVYPQEQYLLVYRTIGELFRRYLQTMETQSCSTEVTMLQSAVAATSENDLSDESEELDLNPHHQHLLEEERGYFQHYSSPLALASENLTPYKYEDLHWVQQQYNPFHVIPEAVNAMQDLHEKPTNSPKLLHTSPAVFMSESIPNKDDTSVLNSSSSPAVPEAVCLMVEDPYFDTPLSSPSSEEAPVDEGQEDSKWTCSPLFNGPSFLLNDQNMEPSSPTSAPANDEAPPPLPKRTPESYFLAEEEELPDPCERLLIIFPPNAADEPMREKAGSPPSPAPPLPERTPESFELASDPVPVTTQARLPLAVNLDIIGLSSEWSGTLTPEDAIQEKPFVRSKSLRAKMTLSAEDSLASPVAKRVPGSFLFPAETSEHFIPLLYSDSACTERVVCLRTAALSDLSALERNMQRPLSMGSTQPLPRVGMSSEWDGSSQPKTFLDTVMNRSKSVRAKSSRSEPLSAFPQLTPLPVVAAEGGSVQVEQQSINHRPTPNSDRSGSKADKSNEKSLLRSKLEERRADWDHLGIAVVWPLAFGSEGSFEGVQPEWTEVG
ncbi:hypothetical protein CCH79_00006430 [Gambusia affinis]|uniref:protein-tyrosine-phosphatase n=1 Tax=Gambusia affinis TaxID=33528 RepID=A0A315W779_GAMAF|nr:hypothetical protein CCH79_00006430 [Gambusia affinis]